MLFNSLHFLLFFLVVFGVYWRLPRRVQNFWLLAASLFFYGYWDWRFLPLLLGSTTLDYAVALGIGRAHQKGRPAIARGLLWLSVAANVGVLVSFKAFGLFSEVLREHDSANRYGSLAFVIPIGLSFYTFQALSYIIDVYRRQIEPARFLPDFMLYISFFPQLIAGPIERAGDLMPQLWKDRRLDAGTFFDSLFIFFWGLFLKAVVADNLLPFVVGYFEQPAATGSGVALLSAYAAMFQVYGDFAGYTAMALGIAGLLGFRLTPNFRQPYFARNPQEFWSRWHITLMTWFRHYVFFPLAHALNGRIGSSAAVAASLTVTMLIFALWHGFTLTFLLWGVSQVLIFFAYHGIHAWAKKTNRRGPPAWVQTLIWFHLLMFTSIIYRSRSLSDFALHLQNLGRGFDARGLDILLTLLVFAGPVLAVEAAHVRSGDDEFFRRRSWAFRATAAGLVYLAVVLCGAPDSWSFIYFHF